MPDNCNIFLIRNSDLHPSIFYCFPVKTQSKSVRMRILLLCDLQLCEINSLNNIISLLNINAPQLRRILDKKQLFASFCLLLSFRKNSKCVRTQLFPLYLLSFFIISSRHDSTHIGNTMRRYSLSSLLLC